MGMDPILPPEMDRVTLPVGDGVPDPDTLIASGPRQLGKVNPDRHTDTSQIQQHAAAK